MSKSEKNQYSIKLSAHIIFRKLSTLNPVNKIEDLMVACNSKIGKSHWQFPSNTISSGLIYSFCRWNLLPFIISCVRSPYDVPPNVRKWCPAKQSADQEIGKFLSFQEIRTQDKYYHTWCYAVTLKMFRWTSILWVEQKLGKGTIYRFSSQPTYWDEFAVGTWYMSVGVYFWLLIALFL